MVNNLSKFVFFNEGSTQADSKALPVVNGESIVVQVSGVESAAAIKFFGMVDAEAEEWSELAIIDLGDFSIKDTITANSIAVVNCAGFAKVKATCTSGLGSVKVFGMMIG